MAYVCHAQDSLVAQPASPLLRNYQFVKQQEPWLTGDNAAGLITFSAKNICEAEISLAHGGGNLTDLRGSSNVLEVGASVESFYRISRRTVAYGTISYTGWTGRDMAGSAFMRQRLPFDIIEQTNDNTGRKHRDTYRLTGAVGVDLWRGYSVGARLDYTAANYAKYKDLRHSNKLMDLKLSVGAIAPVLPCLTVGANYQYHRTTESVTFSTYGKEDRVYNSIVDFGAMMGRLEQFGSTGYTDKSREMPLVENQNGGSVQIEWKPAAALSLHNELTMAHRAGYYGRKSPYTIVYTNHHANILAYQGRFTLRHANSIHQLAVRAEVENMVNNRENYTELKNEAGATHYEYFTDTRTGNKRWSTLDVDYTLHLGMQGETPTWTVSAGYHRMNRRQTSYVYPYYRRQDISVDHLSAGLTRNIITRRGVWSLSLQAAWQKGQGEPYVDGTYVTPGEKQTQPATMDYYLLQEHHRLTARQYHVGGELKYAFLFPATQLKTHIRASVQHRKSTEGSRHDYTTAALAIGCTF